nr:hypothetical protein [Aurantimonas aggregata]
MNPILLMGGYGAIGRLAARELRSRYPDLPLLIGGRDLAKGREAAAELGKAEGVVLDPSADDLGLGERPVGAVAVFYSDDRLAGLQFALARGVPHLGISSGIYEIAPEIGNFMLKPTAAPVVLGYEWLVGATTVATLEAAKAYGRIDDIVIGALVDEEDGGGPAVAEDFERLQRMMPAALTPCSSHPGLARYDDTRFVNQNRDCEAKLRDRGSQFDQLLLRMLARIVFVGREVVDRTILDRH